MLPVDVPFVEAKRDDLTVREGVPHTCRSPGSSIMLALVGLGLELGIGERIGQRLAHGGKPVGRHAGRPISSGRSPSVLEAVAVANSTLSPSSVLAINLAPRRRRAVPCSGSGAVLQHDLGNLLGQPRSDAVEVSRRVEHARVFIGAVAVDSPRSMARFISLPLV